jgi:hypothetical protein
MTTQQLERAIGGPLITYAKVGGPPDNWPNVIIIDKATGAEVRDVMEVDALGGWLVRYRRHPDGSHVLGLDEKGYTIWERERIEGDFEIRFKP